jgi:hypothetical protein
MRPPIWKKVKQCFEEVFNSRYPAFETIDLNRGMKAWALKLNGLTFFVTLQGMKRYDQFFVEVAWSESGDFPWGATGQVAADKPEGRESLGFLWQKSGPEPVWDIVPEVTRRVAAYLDGPPGTPLADTTPDQSDAELMPRIPPLVEDAVTKFGEFGLPLFRQVAAARHVDLPDLTSR